MSIKANSPDWLKRLYLPAGDYEAEAAAASAGATGDFAIAISVDDPLWDAPFVHNTAAWNAMGYTGAGVKVGVIDDGFGNYEDMVGVEVPAPAGENCASDQPSDCLTSVRADTSLGIHGTGVAEAIYDVAPDAELYLANADSRGGVSAAVDYVIEQGVDVVNMSLSFSWDGPPDGASPYSNGIGRSVDRAVRSGATWVNSAGNAAVYSWSGEYADADGDDIMEFAPGDETNTLNRGGLVTLEMRWDDDWRGADTDLDLYILDSQNRVAASSLDFQTGRAGHIPYERVSSFLWSGTFRAVVRHVSGDAPAWVQLRDIQRNSWLEHANEGSVTYPADGDNPGMLGVGAAAWHDADELQWFSGRGPSADGRIKPDLVAADSGISVAYDREFFGTSQASPHVAGMAALVKGRYPDMTPEQVARYLKDQAVPRAETPGDESDDHGDDAGGGDPHVHAQPGAPRDGVPLGDYRPVRVDPDNAGRDHDDDDRDHDDDDHDHDHDHVVPNNTWGYGFARMPDTPFGISRARALNISDEPDAGDALGYSIAMSADGDTVVAGAPGDDGGALDAGAAYVFAKRSGGSWSVPVRLTAPGAAAADRFGESVAISADGGFIAVGAPGVRDGAGAVYVFAKPATGWADASAAAAKLEGRRPWRTVNFGLSVSISADGGAVAVGGREDEAYANILTCTTTYLPGGISFEAC